MRWPAISLVAVTILIVGLALVVRAPGRSPAGVATPPTEQGPGAVDGGAADGGAALLDALSPDLAQAIRAAASTDRDAVAPDLGLLRPDVAALADTGRPLDQRLFTDHTADAPLESQDVAALVGVVTDRSEELVVRHEAMLLLGAADPERAAEVLAGVLADPDDPTDARAYATQHLGMLAEAEGPAWIATLLVSAFERDPGLAVRREAFLALARIDAPRVRPLLDDPTDPQVAGMGDLVVAWWEERDLRQHADRIPDLLAGDDERILLGAAALAGAWRITAARDALRGLRDHPSARIRDAAAVALRAMADDTTLAAPAVEPPARTTP